MSLFNKVIGYLANEVVVKQLANSRLFQRAALRTHEIIEGVAKEATQAKKVVQDQVQQAVKSMDKKAPR